MINTVKAIQAIISASHPDPAQVFLVVLLLRQIVHPYVVGGAETLDCRQVYVPGIGNVIAGRLASSHRSVKSVWFFAAAHISSRASATYAG